MRTEQTPKCIVDALAALRSERGPLMSRLDAIDLAIDNLSRVYGVNGTPQPLPLDVPRPRRIKRPAPVTLPGAVEQSDAAARRLECLTAIGSSPHGMTLAQLRKATPKMDAKARTNALQALRTRGELRRQGNVWVKATAA